MRNFLLGALAVIIVAGIGAGAYFYGKQNSQPQPSSVPTPTVTKESSPTPSPTTQPTTQSTNDSDLIKQALFTKHGWKESDNINFDLATNDGQYASGTVSSQGGGGYFYAAKVNGVWEIVADGNGVILCSSLTKYPDFPKTLIPECWNDKTQKLIKR